MAERRTHRTPFTTSQHGAGFWIVDSTGANIGVIADEGVANFIVRACNRYDNLMGAFDLCRGHMDSLTIQPHTAPSLKAFSVISDALVDDIQRNGR